VIEREPRDRGSIPGARGRQRNRSLKNFRLRLKKKKREENSCVNKGGGREEGGNFGKVEESKDWFNTHFIKFTGERDLEGHLKGKKRG